MRASILALLLVACAGNDAGDIDATSVRIVRVTDAPLPETDHVPSFEIHLEDANGSRTVGIVAVDAIIEPTTGRLAWIDPQWTLWEAPLRDAPRGKRALADDVILGLAASHGRLAYAVRIDGPETAPFVADLRTGATRALDDAPGPDEVLQFSPDGGEVLVLSGRTGLASLFALGVNDASARQLTNVGLAPGPTLDTTRVAPSPIDRHGVAWGARGIAYRAAAETIVLAPGEPIARVPADVSVEELVR